MLPQINQMKAMLGAVQNPQAMVNQLLQQNPQVQQVISQYGSVDRAIDTLCRQKGINTQEFLDALK